MLKALDQPAAQARERRFGSLDGDLVALPVTQITRVESTNGNVYDFSVADGLALGNPRCDQAWTCVTLRANR